MNAHSIFRGQACGQARHKNRHEKRPDTRGRTRPSMSHQSRQPTSEEDRQCRA